MNITLDKRWLHQILILVILVLAAWLRLWRLAEVPPGFYADEAYNAMDAIWMLETGSLQPFFVGNNGREPMLHYLGAISMSLLGAKPFAFRLVSALIGIVTVSLTYRWVVTLFAHHPDRRWLALTSALVLAASFWHVLMSRTGFRSVLVPLFYVLTSFLFWYGWQNRSLVLIVVAGVTLGLSQYTYISARLLPLFFGIFILTVSLVGNRQVTNGSDQQGTDKTPLFVSRRQNQPWFRTLFIAKQFREVSEQRATWVTLLILTIVSLVVFLPLGLFFFKNAAAFTMRTGQLFVWSHIIQGKVNVVEHFIDSLSVFSVGYDSLWRLGLVGRPSFGWFNIFAFWMGLGVAISRFRQPQYIFLLISLFVFWLPGLLTIPPVLQPLHLSGLLPAYYTIVAIGLITLASLLCRRLCRRCNPGPVKVAVVLLALIVNGWGTGYDYFSRWANEPTVHKDYDGPLIDLARYLIAESYQSDILLPFSVYAQPTTRFLLYDEFREISDIPMTHSSGRRVLFVDPKTSLDGSLHHVRSSSYVWLTRNGSGDGLAYISRQPPPASFALKPIGNTIPFLNTRTGDLTALLTPLDSLEPARTLFTEWPPLLNAVNYEWQNQFLLIGYDVSVDRSALSHNLTFNLYWQLLADAKYDEYDFLIEILNSQGISMGQTKYSAEELFRWRASGAVISTNRGMEFSPPLAPGTYTIQLSVLKGGEPVQVSYDGRIHGRQAVLGAFEVSEDNLELRSASQ